MLLRNKYSGNLYVHDIRQLNIYLFPSPNIKDTKHIQYKFEGKQVTNRKNKVLFLSCLNVLLLIFNVNTSPCKTVCLMQCNVSTASLNIFI